MLRRSVNHGFGRSLSDKTFKMCFGDELRDIMKENTVMVFWSPYRAERNLISPESSTSFWSTLVSVLI